MDGSQPETREDVAWETESVLLPLDHLGSGAQAVFGMLASLALTRASVVLFDEPEQHLNVLQQEAVLDALTSTLDSLGVGQLFLATHSIKFAKPELDLRRIHRKEGGASAEKVAPPMLSAFEARGPAAPRTESPSMVAHDGSVELPGFVREALGIKPGEFVYFVRDPKAGFRLMSEAAVDAALGDE
jgi:energy-coupling factor transporter ATP-binding protein EcfA2